RPSAEGIGPRRLSEQDAESELVRAAAPQQPDGLMEVDVPRSREPPRGGGLVPRPLELLRPPALDAVLLGFLVKLKFDRGHRLAPSPVYRFFGDITHSDVPQMGGGSAQRPGELERLLLGQRALEPERQLAVLPEQRVARETDPLVADLGGRGDVEEVGRARE